MCLEWIRDGVSSVSDLMSAGRGVLGRVSVLPGVAELLEEVAVEGQFPDGTKLVTIHHPIVREQTDYEAALYGSGLTYKPVRQRSKEDSNAAVRSFLQRSSSLSLRPCCACVDRRSSGSFLYFLFH